jgi:hypothetical protein
VTNEKFVKLRLGSVPPMHMTLQAHAGKWRAGRVAGDTPPGILGAASHIYSYDVHLLLFLYTTRDGFAPFAAATICICHASVYIRRRI